MSFPPENSGFVESGENLHEREIFHKRFFPIGIAPSSNAYGVSSLSLGLPKNEATPGECKRYISTLKELHQMSLCSLSVNGVCRIGPFLTIPVD